LSAVGPAGTRTALITGASSGIGRATALLLAGQGLNVVLVSRSAEVLEEVARACEAVGGRAMVAVADVRDADAVDRAFAAGVERFGVVDAVVHSAAALAYGRFDEVPGEVFDQAVATTLGGTIHVARSALQVFRAQGDRGSLVVVGSLLGKMVAPYMSSYAVPKWAVQGLVRTLQVEARTTPGITISLVTPGGVNTPIYDQAGTYVGRHGRPPPPVYAAEAVARAVARAVDRPRREINVGLANRLVVLGFRLLPALFDVLVDPLMKVAALSRTKAGPTPGNVIDPNPGGERINGRWRALRR
jgi:NAD(P)-dependent dehydrogenase (short-subunit alcohol dehydrogenase family)